MYETTFISVYSLVFGALLGLLVLRRPAYRFARLCCPLAVELVLPPLTAISRVIKDYLTYPTVVTSGKFLDHWSLSDVLLLVLYVGANVVCTVLPLSGVDQIVLRSGTLSVLNLILCFMGPYLGFLADVLAVSVSSCRRLHAAAGTLGAMLAVVHASTAAAVNKTLNLHAQKDVFALMVGQFVYKMGKPNNFGSP